MNTLRLLCSVVSLFLMAGCGAGRVAPAAASISHLPAGGPTKSGRGFTDHGIASPVSENRGTAAAVDGRGRNVALIWLNDHRGGYGLAMVDAETGKCEQWPVPFPTGGDTPFATLLSRQNKFYTHFGSHFCEFDPVKRAFTFVTNTAPQMTFSLLEDDQGVIWSATYPQSGLVSFDPRTRAFRDYGQLYPQNWPQYTSGLCMDEAGWVYWGIGNVAGQILAFDPKTGTLKPLIPEAKRHFGSATPYRAANGKVYGSVGQKDGWIECLAGEARPVEGKPPARAAGDSGHRRPAQMEFADGRKLAGVDLAERVLTVTGPGTGDIRRVSFEYATEGSSLRSMVVTPDGRISGCTCHTSRFYRYNPRTGEWERHGMFKSWNSVARQGDRIYAGCYTGGFLLEWDPARDWVEVTRSNANPRILTACAPVINCPRRMLAYPDGKTLILAGRPGYGCTGGGLLFWDCKTGASTLVGHTNLVRDLTTFSLAALPGGKLLCGTTTQTGQGGEVKAKQAELFILDMASKKVEWHGALFPGVQYYTDVALGSDGLVYGFADQRRFFVFDPARKKVIHDEDISPKFGPVIASEGAGAFVAGPNGALYILFEKGIGRLRPDTRDIVFLAEAPGVLNGMCGGVYLDGRLYFGIDSHLYSYDLGAGDQ